ncbi:L-seryl-tRNA(Sec) selenium transferase [Fusibacter tunisiensis]|uniref:L-seryl-tRNA(Sec) selenium transferase n=1 Tax=Fusibacter tunisiensis TaxID=1008308 RepID=A0ABS2MMV9_9FIRM|nr:L-seryl-tRNA(Sec) selenium transferase [Fusibacter tunisiensis]MBM7560738.1 L-seryl-tRNA(Ser) seleniumtransferase [Fusibacter tunisiensis]
MNELLRQIPKIDLILDKIPNEFHDKLDREILKSRIETLIDDLRTSIKAGEVSHFDVDDIIGRVIEDISKLCDFSLKRVINGTGIVLHTNLGRAVISKDIFKDSIEALTHYNTLEYDVKTGRRGIRYQHIVEKICALTGGESAIVVNNNAAAVMLVLNTFAKNKEVVVSRGELVEIGGSFRVPDVMLASGCILNEIGTTNKTHLRDYENALNEQTGLILKVHTSNYKVVGFSQSVEIDQLATLGKNNEILVYEDIGSGLIHNIFDAIAHDEPIAVDSISKGVDLVSFSGDKLFGGAQAGFIVGKKRHIDVIAKNPLLRAFRIDKFTLAIIERTLTEYLKPQSSITGIPTINKLKESPMAVQQRLKNFVDNFGEALINHGLTYSIVETKAEVGGGAMPLYKLPSFALGLKGPFSVNQLQDQLRQLQTPIIATVSKDILLLDFKTIDSDDFDLLYQGLRDCLEATQ